MLAITKKFLTELQKKDTDEQKVAKDKALREETALQMQKAQIESGDAKQKIFEEEKKKEQEFKVQQDIAH